MPQLVEEAIKIVDKIMDFKVDSWTEITTTGWLVQNGIVSFIEDELRRQSVLKENEKIDDMFIFVPPLYVERHTQDEVVVRVKRIRL